MKSIKARFSLVLFTVILIALSLTITAVAAHFKYDGFSEYGQITHNVYIDPDGAVLDGVISEGEYACEPIKLTPTSNGVYFSDWTDTGLPEDFLKEVLPESMTYYVTYTEKGLYLAAEIVDKHHYGDCGDEIAALWGVDSLAIDISIDAYGDIGNGSYSQANMLDRTRINYGLIEDSSGMLTNASYCYPVSSYGMFSDLESVSYDTYEIRRDESKDTTTYEIFVSWFDLWLEEFAPERVFLNFQIDIADERYTYLAAEGYIACLGGLRYSCKLPDEVMAENGYTNASIYHVFELCGVNPDDEIKTESTAPDQTEETEEADTTEEVIGTEETTEDGGSKNPSPSDTTEATSDDTTEAKTEEKTEAQSRFEENDKDASGDKIDKNSGCSSSLGAMPLAALAFCSVGSILFFKKREKEQ